MCMKTPKAPKMTTPKSMSPVVTPIADIIPTTQSGADIVSSEAKPKKKSLFQIDLSIPTGANTQSTQPGTTFSPGVGPKT